MYLLIFEPGMGCKKKFIDKNNPKINLGKSVRNEFYNIQLSSDFLPDYVGAILYNKDSFYFRSYGKIKISINGKEIIDSKSAVKLTHGSLLKINKDNKYLSIAFIDNDIDNRWKTFRENQYNFLNAKKDKKGYIVRDIKNFIFNGNIINSSYFIPKDGDIFLNEEYIFYYLKGNLFFEQLIGIVQPEPQPQPQPGPPQPQPPQPQPRPPQPQPPQPKRRRRRSNKVSISIQGVTRYDKKKNVYRLNNVNLNVQEGTLVAIMGVSGAGKSTLFNAILGNLKLDSGRIVLNGTEIGYVPQYSNLRGSNSVQDIMKYYAIKKMRGSSKKQQEQKIDDLLDKLNLSLHKKSLFKNLSGGQQRRLDIAVQLLNDPNVILMDEPDSGLDVKSCIELYQILAKLVRDKNSTILVITHNTHMTVKYPYIDNLLFLASQGRICFYGDKNDVTSYFNINDFDKIYNAVEHDQDYYVDKYNKLINK